MFYKELAMEVRISEKSKKKLEWIKKTGKIAKIDSIVNRAIEEYYAEYREDFRALKKYEAENKSQLSLNEL